MVELGGIPPGKVKVIMLKDRKKGQRSKCCTGVRRGKIIKKNSGAFLVVFLPTSSVATWRIDHTLVAPPGGQITTKTTQIRASYYIKWRLLADRSCISVAPLRIVHKLILSKFVCHIFKIK